MEDLRHFAETLARGAGDLLRSYHGKSLHIDFKGAKDLVTEADRASEAYLREAIGLRYPDHEILGEEEGLASSGSAYRWILDPLDGTTNFAHGFPYYCVSVGLSLHGELVVGAVYNPCADELFSAHRGGGATLNGRTLRVSAVPRLEQALVTTGFPYGVIQDRSNLIPFERFLTLCQAVRRAGSAALDLCHVAGGHYDAFWEAGLAPWDVAAGAVIVREAGGLMSDYRGQEFDPYGRRLLASNGLLHEAMVEVLHEGQP